MRRRLAAIWSLVFFCLAPGTVAGIVPWSLTHWRLRTPTPYWLPVQVVGGVVLAAAVAVLVHAFMRFVSEGIGTPAPVAPTEHLVVGGLYRYVRNPMYVAVVAAIAGQALLLGRLSLLGYAVLVAVLQAAFVHLHEEPALRERFGAEYDTYRHAVPPWLPRLRPWHGDPSSERIP